MSSYTIADEPQQVFDKIKKIYQSKKNQYSEFDFTDLDIIFEIACSRPDRFPAVNMQGTTLCRPEKYIERWIRSYYKAMTTHLPSKKIANPKSSCTDPAIKVIVQTTRNLSVSEAEKSESAHNLFMSAENIQGNLLEEYIAGKVKPYGFLWCAGNVLRAIDFCNTDGTILLQIKNKSNTENSSSSSIRDHTGIVKWYRLDTRKKGVLKLPVYKWSDLNKLISKHRTLSNSLEELNTSEDDYQNFLQKVAHQNPNLITDK